MLTLIDNEGEKERNNKLIAEFYIRLTEIPVDHPDDEKLELSRV